MLKEISLKVMEALQEEAYKGVVRIDSETMHQIEVRPGDIIEIEGKRKTVGIVDRAYPTDVGQAVIRMDGILRRNARTGIGELIKVRKSEVKEAKELIIAPAQEGVMIQANPILFKRGLLGRATVKGDVVVLGGARRRKSTMSDSPFFDDVFNMFEDSTFFGGFNLGNLRFIVVDTNPKGAVVISEATNITINPKAVEVSEEKVPEVTYEDIGGLNEEITRIREMVELPLKHPELFLRLGIDPPAGVLLHGPPGTGKTLLAKAVATESEANFMVINGPEIMNKFYGESERKVRQIFEDAEKNAPSIIFIDEIDAIAPKREDVHGEVERRVVSQLLTQMDGLKARGRVIVIGATNRPNSIDPALRRPGRFDRELTIGVPNQTARLQILKIHTRNMPLIEVPKNEEDATRISKEREKLLKDLADITHGFVGADLSALCKEAAMVVLRRIYPTLNLKEKEPLSEEVLGKLMVAQSDFLEALKSVRPSAIREFFVEKPNVKWGDVGGLATIKQELKEAIEWPLKHPESFKRLGIRPPKGVLLYGPPGTGKTLLAKAIATESEANFIQVKGPALLNMWVGESLPYNEEIIVKEKGIVKRMQIGEIVDNKKDVEILAFDKDKRIGFTKIHDYIKHNLTGKLLEVTTRTGRRIKVTDHHSLFSFVNGKLMDIPVSHLVPRESYIAVPKNINLPKEYLKDVNLYDYFKNDKDIFVSNTKEHLSRAKKILGLEKTSIIMGISKKYLSDIIGKNLPISITKFDDLMKESKLMIDLCEIKIKLKGSIHEYSPIFPLSKEFWRLIGIWVAEGDFNGYTVRIHNQNKEIREDIRQITTRFNFSVSEMETCVTLNSLFLQKILKNFFRLEAGAANKRLPSLIFTLDGESKANLLKGYFSGDGSNYGDKKGKFKIEAGTISKGLANDIMYLLLDFGIVATCYQKRERTGSTTYRISILGVKNFERFKNIGFIDEIRNNRILQYINSRKWARSDVIPLSGELYALASQQQSVYKTNTCIGKEKLKNLLVYVDKNKIKYKEYWDLVDGDIFLDLVKDIKVLEPEEFVYDLSIFHQENFVAGFGGIIAHNSEKGVRKVFEKARQTAPTIIFFDEIDALAPKRGLDSGNGVTERIVNTFLAEMDGIEELTNVVIIAATNRPDIMDPALLRPGRFDRSLLTPPPEEDARFEIFKIHTKNMPIALGDAKKTKPKKSKKIKAEESPSEDTTKTEGITKDDFLRSLAGKTEGYVGSDIEAICREAAILSLRKDMEAKEVQKEAFEEALKKVKPSVSKEAMDIYRKLEEENLRSAKNPIAKEAPLAYVG